MVAPLAAQEAARLGPTVLASGQATLAAIHRLRVVTVEQAKELSLVVREPLAVVAEPQQMEVITLVKTVVAAEAGRPPQSTERLPLAPEAEAEALISVMDHPEAEALEAVRVGARLDHRTPAAVVSGVLSSLALVSADLMAVPG